MVSCTDVYVTWFPALSPRIGGPRLAMRITCGVILEFLNAVFWEILFIQTAALNPRTCLRAGTAKTSPCIYTTFVFTFYIVFLSLMVPFMQRAVHIAVQISIWGLTIQSGGVSVPILKLIPRDVTAAIGLMISMSRVLKFIILRSVIFQQYFWQA
jgi:hypothetical protein